MLFVFALLLTSPIETLSPGFDVLSHEVSVTPDFESQSVSGRQTIRFRVTSRDLSTLSFSANSLDLEATLDGELVKVETVDERRYFHLPRALARGATRSLVISFRGSAPRGLVWTADTVHSTYFVCDTMVCDQDRPGDKAELVLRVSVAPDLEVIAPGRRVDNASTPTSRTTRFRSRRPLSPYLMGFAAGRYRRVDIEGSRLRLPVFMAPGTPEDLARVFADTPLMVDFFTARSGVRLGDDAYAQVVVAGSEAQEMANHSMIGVEHLAPMLQNPQEDWVIAHELAHQWWGNSVTCLDWSELWLNEGLVVFMVAAWKEHRFGRAAYERELELAQKRWGAARELGFDVPLSWSGHYPSLRHKRAMAYAKSVVFLDLLRRELGETAFWRAIKGYTRAHWGGTVTARDLQRSFEHAAKRDLSDLFEAWVYGPR